MSQEWRPITDYQEDPAALADKELPTLAKVWIEQKQNLDISGFMQRLEREWAIETGLIERLYTLDRGITEQLIEHGLDAALIPHTETVDAQQAIAMIGDHRDAIEEIFSFVNGARSLSVSYIKELHSLFTRHQYYVEGRDPFGKPTRMDLIRGDYKQQPNNPTHPDGTLHPYCPPEHVAAEMDALIEMHQGHAEVAPEVEAAWLHHRFTQIHPFQDGNGRLARALATLVFVKQGWFPLLVRNSERNEYIKALEKADEGELGPLVAFFSRCQKQQITRALGIAEDIFPAERVDERISSIEQRLARRQDALISELGAATTRAESLRQLAERRLCEVRDSLQNATANYSIGFRFNVNGQSDQDDNSHYYQGQIISTAKALDYYANMRLYRSWVRLVAQDGGQSNILISFHVIGHVFQGILGCSATWFQRLPIGNNENEVVGVAALCVEVFRINCKELEKATEARFDDWLNAVIERGLALWERSVL